MRFLLLCFAFSTPAAALDLTFRSAMEMGGPSSLEFDTTLCGLWIANESQEIAFMGASGEITRTLRTELFTAKAITVTPDGLIIADGFGSFESRSRDGVLLIEKYRLGPNVWDVEGLAARPDGSIVLTQDDNARIWAMQGKTELWAIDGFQTQPPMTEPQGIAYDRRTGALYAVDDWEGTNSLFEFAPDGTLLATVPLIQYGSDPEGIAIQADTGTMWIGFDDGNRLVTFDYLPTLRNEAEDAHSDACALF